MIATSVGGIPEIVDGSAMGLVPPDDVEVLTSVMRRHLADRAGAQAEASSLQQVILNRF